MWLTEHGFHPDDAVDEVVEVDLAVLVAVALHQAVERAVADAEPCSGINDISEYVSDE